MTPVKLTRTTRARYAKAYNGKPIKLRIGDIPVPRASRKVPLATIRCNELDRYFDDRYGPILPDDDAGREDAILMLHHIAFRQGVDRQLEMNQWLDRRAPAIVGEERKAIIARVFRKPILFKPDTLAAKLGLRYARRQRLKIRTIGATDVTAEERKEIRTEKARSRKAAARRAAGCMTREEYEKGSLNKIALWTALGVSRATFYRRQKRAKKSSRTHYAADGLVSPVSYGVMIVSAA